MKQRWLIQSLVSGLTLALSWGCQGPDEDGGENPPLGEGGQGHPGSPAGPDTGAGGSSTDGGGSGGGTQGSGGGTSDGTGGSGDTEPLPEPEPTCEVEDPDEYSFLPSVGGGTNNQNYVTSDHFAVFDAQNASQALHLLEAAHQCFVRDWCWRSAGLSRHSDDDPHRKLNVYSKMIEAGGVMGYDHRTGLSYIEVRPQLVTTPGVLIHEYGHSLTLAAQGWVDQGNTGLWWEAIANFVAESFLNSSHCAEARADYNIAEGGSILETGVTLGNSHWTICNNQNHYQAWPFFTYLTNNPDQYPGLGKMVVPELFRTHKRNNETPLHVLERLSQPVSVQTILGRYWARMAYVDIGSPQAQDKFFRERGRINYDNLDSLGGNTYRVKSTRRPRYGGANIIPLTVNGGQVSAQVALTGNNLPDSGFTATFAVLGADRSVRYVDLPGGRGEVSLASGEELSLVIVHTPRSLYMYNPSDFGGGAETSHPANTGLNYEVTLTGAAP